MACPEGPKGVAATLQKEGFAAKVGLVFYGKGFCFLLHCIPCMHAPPPRSLITRVVCGEAFGFSVV